ncbi:MAG: hypothetical protein ABR928_15300 [Terracidiphilus sp.]|jgi:Flp pilus assembly protein TadG
MKLISKIPILGRLIQEDKGQALVFTAVVLTAFIGVTGIAVDAGKGYYAFELLKASTNAAALAGAAGLPNTTTATTYADDYGSEISAQNANGVMNTVTTVPTFSCNTTVTSQLNISCLPNPGTTGTGNNTITVKQTAVVPTWIGPLFGMPNFHIQATAAAAMSGGAYIPYNIAVVVDTTASMNDADDGKNSSSSCTTQIACARLGLQTLLGYLYPCQSSGTCGTSDTSVDNVALFVFPTIDATGMKVGSGNSQTAITDDTKCTTTNPPIEPYTFTSSVAPGGLTSSNTTWWNQAMLVAPTTTGYGGYTDWATPFENSYKTKDQTASLVASDPIVIAAGGGSCSGLQAPGGAGTYYAQVIYQAQAALEYETAQNGYKNAMIILTDGDATACNSQSYPSNDCTTGTAKSSEFQIQASNCPYITASNGAISSTAPCAGSYTGQPINGTFCATSASTTYPTCTTQIKPAGYDSPTYPSVLGECGQAVQAAQAASAAGTTVYTIGYGTEMSGCTTDSSYSTSASGGTYGANSWAAGGTPCDAIGAMATSSTQFYSDDANGCAPTLDSHKNLTSLQSIFTSVAQSLSTARLIPISWS